MNSATPPPDPDEVPWLSHDEKAAWLSLTAMLMTLPAAIDAQLKRDSGLNFFEYSILVSLERPENHKVRMSVLAMMAGGSMSRLSHAVSRLERQGWVRRVAADGEPRCVSAELTEAGLAVLVAAAPGHVREARRLVFDPLTAAQVKQLQKACREIVGVTDPGSAATLDEINLGKMA
ncbi:MarR family winged helix-turn-helix transcriptional regulator [Paractinoplanes ferrugineus]|uniref:MarR family transcriptional regulator n=1 Tax=Paractinoplanes ferrugineus TaxID=113564 RepID=A0A919MGE7_9ACTN|nr:MarR family transcriptional regulator [Actinoplanes ferrugineus]GIE14748.1 MarR family transcriptional regulator [Actinoplanes ferrugineus]